MNWDSWSGFWAMGGLGVYVWGVYLIAFAVIAAEVALLILRRHSILDHLGRIRHAHRQSDSPPGNDLRM